MAIDTLEKRNSALNFAGMGGDLLPVPNGGLTLPDRQTLLDCYSGIAFAQVAIPSEILEFTSEFNTTLSFDSIFEDS